MLFMFHSQIMSTLSAVFYVVSIVASIDGSDTIWSDSAETSEQFRTSGTVSFDTNQDYCPNGCAQITATSISSYLETIAIDTSGYKDIFVTFSFALSAWSTQNYFFVDYSTIAGGGGFQTVLAMTSSGYGTNREYNSTRNLTDAGNCDTLYIRFGARTTDLNTQDFVYIYDISVLGTGFVTAMPITTSPPSYNSSSTQNPTKSPSQFPSIELTTNPSSAPSVRSSSGSILATEASENDDSVIVAETTKEHNSGFVLSFLRVCIRNHLKTLLLWHTNSCIDRDRVKFSPN